MKTKYRVGALVTGTIYADIYADNEEEAKEIMNEKYGDAAIPLCVSCSQIVSDLAVSEDIDTYMVEETGHIIE